jgi:hypothetical protein
MWLINLNISTFSQMLLALAPPLIAHNDSKGVRVCDEEDTLFSAHFGMLSNQVLVLPVEEMPLIDACGDTT